MARMKWVGTFCHEKATVKRNGKNLNINLWSSEFELFVRYWSDIQGTEQITRCNGAQCPDRYKKVREHSITFR